MMRANRITESTVLGSGLVALDVILNGTPSTPAKLCAGGSCGNVLSILSYFGWTSKPIARLSKNGATKKLFDDFQKFNVDTSLVTTSDDGKTPIIIHRILKDKEGNSQHKFEFKIPGTNIWLPMFKPVLANLVETIIEKQKKTNVFYFDRVSRSTIDLAKYYLEKGALLVFEPSSLKDDKQTLECLALAHVIKFSKDRINNYSELFPSPNGLLEIETLGKDGLQYRLKANNDQSFKTVPPFLLDNIKDTAGAGDWCTAGIINEIGFNGINSFKNLEERDIVQALKIGQALGAINCTFDGARGSMYNMEFDTLIKLVEKIINNKPIQSVSQDKGTSIQTVVNLEFSSLL